MTTRINKKIALTLVLTGVTASLLSGCSVSAPKDQPLVASAEPSLKEAGSKGARICVRNDSQKPVSIQPSSQLDPDNGHLAVGLAGDIPFRKELCVAGWNSFHFETVDTSTYDSVVSVAIDGEYDALVFGAYNWMFNPVFMWATSNYDSKNSGGHRYDTQASDYVDFNGHSFQVSRVADSEYYKEFLVRIIK